MHSLTPQQTDLITILRTQLRTTELDMSSNFFASGGDSLLAITVVNQAEEQGIVITVRDLLVQPTFQDLLRALPEPAPAPSDDEPFALLTPGQRAAVPGDVVDVMPASALQAGMLFLCETSSRPDLYHLVNGWTVDLPFDERRFRDALAVLVRQHPALRTAFDLERYHAPMQVVQAGAEVPLDTERAAPQQAQAAAQRWFDTRLAMPFDWATAPLARCHVVDSGSSFHVALAVHHLVVDGWSMSRLIVDLMAAYRDPGAAPTGTPQVSARAQRRFLAAEHAALNSAAARDHWLRQAEPARAPAAGRPGAAVHATDRHDVTLGADLVRDLQGTARLLGASVKAVALAAHAGALAAWSGQDQDVVTGVVFNTRPAAPGSELATGLFLNILPIRFRSVRGSWAALVHAAAEVERAGLDHLAYPQARLVEQLGRPAFGVSFNFVSYHAYRELGDDVPATGHWRRGLTSFPFQVTLELAGGRGELRVSSDPAVITGTAVAQYARLLVRTLTAVSQNPLGSVQPMREAVA